MSMEHYDKNEMSKANRPQTGNKLIDKFAQINKHEQLHNTEMEEKETAPETMQSVKHTNIEHMEKIEKSSN